MIVSEKETATHSSVVAWRLPWTEEPGALLSVGSHRDGHDSSNLAAAAAAVSTEQQRDSARHRQLSIPLHTPRLFRLPRDIEEKYFK